MTMARETWLNIILFALLPATALAALMSGAYKPAKGERVAVLICGANIAPDPLQP